MPTWPGRCRGMRSRIQLRGLHVAAVPELLWLLILHAADCMVDTPPTGSRLGVPSAAPTQHTASPIGHLQLHARLRLLTWTYRSPVSEHACGIEIPPGLSVNTTPRALDNDTYFCSFPNSLLHRGARLTVRAVVANATFQEALRFENTGRAGAGATNLSCIIYNVHFMNCSWAPGHAAPADTQYQFFFWFNPRDAEAECTHYLLDSKGMHVGCHFTQLSREPKMSDNYFFLVNGTSNETAIPFLDAMPFVAFLNEKYNPPANVTVTRRDGGFVVRWDNPVRRFEQSPSTLYYHLQIWRKGGGPKRESVFHRGQDRNEYALASAESSVRLRVRHIRGAIWSEWSETLSSGAGRGYGSLTWVRVLVVVAVVALCTVMPMIVCKKYSLQQRLLPPVPQVKDELRGIFTSEQEVTVKEPEPAADNPEPKDVLAVWEMQ